jgi:hypothetical protein
MAPVLAVLIVGFAGVGHFPIARLHFTKATGLWSWYWRDDNLKYHRYQPLDPSPQIQDLVDHLDSGTEPIVWG